MASFSAIIALIVKYLAMVMLFQMIVLTTRGECQDVETVEVKRYRDGDTYKILMADGSCVEQSCSSTNSTYLLEQRICVNDVLLRNRCKNMD